MGPYQDVEEWKEILRSLLKLNQKCLFQSETFVLAVHILDDFLGFVKVHGKYLNCAAYASYYIACKLLEEDEFVPELSTFVELIGHKFTTNDITRMEKIILEKTEWNMNHVTICNFLDIYYSLVCGKYFKTLFGSDSLAYSIYRNLAAQGVQCITYVSLINFKGSIKALALLSCTLEKITSRWFSYIEEICQMGKIQIQDVLECRDVIKNSSVWPTKEAETATK
ncbi:cyclin-I-like [Clytia hemisphaerica]|uniref:cyclin-I-like n=1 Tax=Clytia hemisphaerica TaxID=252671 RepID=UPI0034D6AD51